MVRCAAVRKRGSLSQCEAAALRGHALCGRHARCKAPVLWADLHRSRGTTVENIQALARGWLVRRRLALAGPGVLSRKGLGNDEDLFTCEVKDKQHPLEYFAFEDNGKIWWFDFPTFWQWCSRTYVPINPYTNTPLSSEVRKRLRELWYTRLHLRIQLPTEAPTYIERLQQRWNILSQTFRDNGFEDVHPAHFLDLSKSDYLSMFVLLEPDIETVFPETDPFRRRAVLLCKRGKSSAVALQSNQYILQSAYTLMILLGLHKDPYTMAFSILSAIFRC